MRHRRKVALKVLRPARAAVIGVVRFLRVIETTQSCSIRMSPQAAMGARAIDVRTDQYALACVLYEMLVGEPPFTGPTAQAIVARVLISDASRIAFRVTKR